MKKKQIYIALFVMISYSLFAHKSTKDEKAFFKIIDKDGKSDIEELKKLLKKGIDINVKDELSKESALMHAIEEKNLKVIYFLIDNGIDLEVKASLDKTALLIAVEKIVKGDGNKKINFYIVKALLANNALYDARDRFKTTALSEALKNDKLKRIFNEIIDYKAAIDKNKKRNALVQAITHNDKNDSNFTKEQWLRLALLRNDTKQLLYALEKKVVKVDDILHLIASVPRMPIDFIAQLLSENLIEFNGLEKYYDSAKKADNKKFGRYYLELKKLIKSKKSKYFSEDILQQIGSFLPVESEKNDTKNESEEITID